MAALPLYLEQTATRTVPGAVEVTFRFKRCCGCGKVAAFTDPCGLSHAALIWAFADDFGVEAATRLRDAWLGGGE